MSTKVKVNMYESDVFRVFITQDCVEYYDDSECYFIDSELLEEYNKMQDEWHKFQTKLRFIYNGSKGDQHDN